MNWNVALAYSTLESNHPPSGYSQKNLQLYFWIWLKPGACLPEFSILQLKLKAIKYEYIYELECGFSPF